MGLVDFVEEYLMELKKQGMQRVPLQKVVEEVATRYGCLPNSVYNAIKVLELKGKVKKVGNRKKKLLEILL